MIAEEESNVILNSKHEKSLGFRYLNFDGFVKNP